MLDLKERIFRKKRGRMGHPALWGLKGWATRGSCSPTLPQRARKDGAPGLGGLKGWATRRDKDGKAENGGQAGPQG
jgi:hypothetical protein